MPQIPVQPARQGAPQCGLNSIHICTNVLFCFVLFDFVFILLFFAGVLPLSRSLSLTGHIRVSKWRRSRRRHTQCLLLHCNSNMSCSMPHTHSHTPSRELCLVPRVVLVTSSYYPHAMYATICACERERKRVCVSVCVQLGQFKRRRRRRRPCKGLHAHLPDSFHCGDLLCEAPVAFCGCVSHKQTTANTHTHTHTSERYKE